MASIFEAHVNALISARGLDTPDGRHLYEYRLTDDEFSSLESFLKHYIAKFGRFSNSSLDLIKDSPGFPELFVLYCAEWWRRRYSGSGFCWEPILNDLDVATDCWTHSQRSACVTAGMRKWRLSLRPTGGLRYLGTIALQGGLPMHLLAQSKGNLGRILRTVLKEATKSTASSADIEGWVASLNHDLPRIYQQPEIYMLLAEVVATVLQLKEEAKLKESAGAIAHLDRHIPCWRERFPLPIGDSDAQKLVEQLIRDAATAKIARHSRLCAVERFLEKDGADRWRLRSRLALPDCAELSKVRHLWGLELVSLPRFMDLTLKVNGADHSTSMRKLAGHDKFRIDRCLWNFSDPDAAEEHVLQVSAPDGCSWSATAPQGESLDPEFPWIFEATEDGFPFLRQGGGAVAAKEAIVALPEGWVASPGEEELPTLIGLLDQFKRKLFRVSGTACFFCNEIVYRVRTGRADATADSFEWRGNRLWGAFVKPSMAFAGVPAPYKVDENGRALQMTGPVGWRPAGARGAVSGRAIGPVEGWYPTTGEVKLRSRMVLLPNNASTSMVFSSASSGEIRLRQWGTVRAALVTPGVSSAVQCSSDIMTIALKTQDNVPEWVELDLYWPHTPTPARVRFPYPARGARAFDATGRELAQGSLLSANGLCGMRIQCLAGDQAQRISLELRMPSGKSSSFRICTPDHALHTEIRLQDYASEISQLLATDDRTDASVEARVRVGSEVSTRLRIARYESRLARENGKIYLDANDIRGITAERLASLPVMAMRLEFPGEDAVPLSGFTSQGVATGVWEFAPEEREPGSWLIFPAADASFSFRPTIWPVPGNPAPEGAISTAMSKVAEADRVRSLVAAIDALSQDFLHEGWSDVERLASQLGHLPLVTLDLWRCFARSASGMAALAMRFGSLPAGFLQRFACELPFAWEAVPFSAWLSTLVNLKAQCDSLGGAAAIVFNSHLDNRIAELTSFHPALYTLLGVARAAATGSTPPEIISFRQLGVEALGGFLFSGDDSALQRLLRAHADTDELGVRWPTYFNNGRLRNAGYGRYATFFWPNPGFHDGVVNLPILMAAQAAADDSEEWFGDPHIIDELRKHIAFDPDWFTEAYLWTTARCLAAGLLNFEGKL